MRFPHLCAGEGEPSFAIGYPELVSLKAMPSAAFFKGSLRFGPFFSPSLPDKASSPCRGNHYLVFPALPSSEAAISVAPIDVKTLLRKTEIIHGFAPYSATLVRSVVRAREFQNSLGYVVYDALLNEMAICRP